MVNHGWPYRFTMFYHMVEPYPKPCFGYGSTVVFFGRDKMSYNVQSPQYPIPPLPLCLPQIQVTSLMYNIVQLSWSAKPIRYIFVVREDSKASPLSVHVINMVRLQGSAGDVLLSLRSWTSQLLRGGRRLQPWSGGRPSNSTAKAQGF